MNVITKEFCVFPSNYGVLFSLALGLGAFDPSPMIPDSCSGVFAEAAGSSQDDLMGRKPP